MQNLTYLKTKYIKCYCEKNYIHKIYNIDKNKQEHIRILIKCNNCKNIMEKKYGSQNTKDLFFYKNHNLSVEPNPFEPLSDIFNSSTSTISK
jgi:hypothetical protein